MQRICIVVWLTPDFNIHSSTRPPSKPAFFFLKEPTIVPCVLRRLLARLPAEE